MKLFKEIILAILFVVLSFGCWWSTNVFAGPEIFLMAKQPTGGGGGSYLLSEDFEGTAPAWTQVGSPSTLDYGYTTNPLEGTKSLRIVGSGSDDGAYTTTTSQTHVYGFFEFLFTTTGGNEDAFYVADSGGSPLFVFYVASNNYFSVYVPGDGGYSFANTCTNNTKYYLWWEYSTGSGNGIIKWYMSTTTTKPGTTEMQIINGTYSASAVRYYFVTGASIDHRFDHIRVSTSDITGYP